MELNVIQTLTKIFPSALIVGKSLMKQMKMAGPRSFLEELLQWCLVAEIIDVHIEWRMTETRLPIMATWSWPNHKLPRFQRQPLAPHHWNSLSQDCNKIDIQVVTLMSFWMSETKLATLDFPWLFLTGHICTSFHTVREIPVLLIYWDRLVRNVSVSVKKSLTLEPRCYWVLLALLYPVHPTIFPH